MNLLKTPLRRTAAALAGAFLGMAAAVAVATPASAHHPDVNGTANCVVDGKWTVDWTVTNTWNAEATITAVKVDGAVGGDIAEGTKIPAKGDVTGTQADIPADAREVGLTVSLEWADGHREDKSGTVAQKTEGCAEEPETPPTTTPPTEAAPAEPTPILEMYCDALVLGLDNPADGQKITIDIETSKGEKRQLVVKPGEKKTTQFSASEGFSITIRATGLDTDSETIAWEKPEGCDSGSGGGEPELPLTGAAAGSIAGGAGALLAIGAALFITARRRKIKFTA